VDTVRTLVDEAADGNDHDRTGDEVSALGVKGDVLLVREAIPGHSSQLRGWMTCAVLTAHLLGRKYLVWTPHQLYRLLLRELQVCRVNVPALLEQNLSRLQSGGHGSSGPALPAIRRPTGAGGRPSRSA